MCRCADEFMCRYGEGLLDMCKCINEVDVQMTDVQIYK